MRLCISHNILKWGKCLVSRVKIHPRNCLFSNNFPVFAKLHTFCHVVTKTTTVKLWFSDLDQIFWNDRWNHGQKEVTKQCLINIVKWKVCTRFCFDMPWSIVFHILSLSFKKVAYELFPMLYSLQTASRAGKNQSLPGNQGLQPFHFPTCLPPISGKAKRETS
jgi:hypothetical protein